MHIDTNRKTKENLIVLINSSCSIRSRT